MKLLRNLFVSWRAGVLAVLTLLAFAGCETMDGAGPGSGVDTAKRAESADDIRVGELLTIELLDITPSSKIEQTVGEDGTITMPLLSSRIPAAGKKVGELQNAIHDAYVPSLYRRMTVNIKRENRYYFVGGEVKTPSQRPYTGDMTVVRAIKSVGDFTDFANKKAVEVIRANGTRVKVNVLKAIDNPKYDVPIYPGDTIHVKRTLWGN